MFGYHMQVFVQKGLHTHWHVGLQSHKE